MRRRPLPAILLAGVCTAALIVGFVGPHTTAQPIKGEPPAPGAKLTPKTPADGPALEFDFPSLLIGIAEYDEGPTGVTVFYFPKRVFTAIDVRGGAPGTLETDAIRVGYGEKDEPAYDAICLTGGSSLGLEAATGVMAEILARRSNSTKWEDIPGVSSAVVYDFNNRTNAIHPDKELGRAAFKAAKPGRFLLGARGAGRFVHVGGYFGATYRERSGQGGAFRQVGSTKIAVFTVVNPLGAIVDRQGQVVRGNVDPKTGKRAHIGDDLKTGAKSKPPGDTPGPTQRPKQNTTITIVVTNQKMSYVELQRLAIQTHTSLNRAIQPFHTADDGDTLFAVTTAEVNNENLSLRDLSTHATELAWDAVLSSPPK
jgi:L-aminopeptidase/D-esterase-like protein